MILSLKSTIIRIGLPVLFSVLALILGVVFLSNAPVSAAGGLAAGRTLDSDHLVVGINGSPLNLDPASDIDLNKMLIVRQIYDTLTNYDTAAAQLAPQLAESWSVSADGVTWTFNLRTDVTFHDGTPLDAAAVVYNFERWWDPLHPQHTGDFIYFEALFGGYKGSPDTLLAGVTAGGSYQVELQLTRPNSLIPTLLTNPAFSIASPAALQNGELNSMPVGSAAYTLFPRMSITCT